MPWLTDPGSDVWLDDFARRLQISGTYRGAVHAVHRHGLLRRCMEQMKPEALKRIQNSLVLEAVAKAENIEIRR